MAFKFSPRIVTDGLILYSDVSNSRSFISGSTTLNDMSLIQRNGILSGATTYTTNNVNNVPSIRFSSITNDGGSVSYGSASTYSLNSGSVAVFFKIPSQVDTVNYKPLICKQNRYGLFVINNVLVTYDWGNTTSRPTTFTITDSVWRYATMTFTDMTGTPSNNAKIYVDGNLLLTTTIKVLTGTTGDFTPLLLGYGNSANQFLTGDINVVQVYNRVLTQQEITQNYNTLKSRFGK